MAGEKRSKSKRVSGTAASGTPLGGLSSALTLDPSDPRTDALLRSVCLENLAVYASSYLSGPSQAPYNGRFLLGPHHKEWAELANKYDRICILAHRDSGKSYTWALAYPLWMAERFPGDKGYILSNGQDQAMQRLGAIKAEIETNPRLQHLLPSRSRGSYWSDHRIKLSNGTTIYARGFGSRLRGGHPRWLVGDDMVSDEAMYSESVRLRNKHYWLNSVSNMVIPGGQIVVVGTPVSDMDLYLGVLAENPEYIFRKYPALDEKGEPFWPARYDKIRLARKRREITELPFAREFLLSPRSSGSSMFPMKLLCGGEPGSEKHFDLEVRLGPSRFWKGLLTKHVLGIDLAISTNPDADYTVLFCKGVDKNGVRWITEIRRLHGRAYSDQLDEICRCVQEMGIDEISIESVAMQRIFGQELRKRVGIPVHDYVTGKSKHDEHKGLPILRPPYERGEVRIPRGDDRSVEMTDIWLHELTGFVVDEAGMIVSTTKHDDCAMADFFCEQRLGGEGFSYTFADFSERPEVGLESGAVPAAALDTNELETVLASLLGPTLGSAKTKPIVDVAGSAELTAWIVPYATSFPKAKLAAAPGEGETKLAQLAGGFGSELALEALANQAAELGAAALKDNPSPGAELAVPAPVVEEEKGAPIRVGGMVVAVDRGPLPGSMVFSSGHGLAPTADVVGAGDISGLIRAAVKRQGE